MSTGERLSKRIRVGCRSAVSLAVLSILSSVAAAQSVAEFDLPAQPLGDALRAVAGQTNSNILFDRTLVAGLTAKPLKKQATAEEALEKLLSGTGLTYRHLDEKTVTIVPMSEATSTDRRDGTSTSSGHVSYGAEGIETSSSLDSTDSSGRIRIARAESSQDASAKTSAQTTPRNAARVQDLEPLDAVTVTGTRIRGGSTASPTISIDAEQIQQEGFSDLGEVIRSIPQNFSGGQNPGVAPGASAGGLVNQNISGGSALNLRGLGPDATLTLLNGRRMSYDGFGQAVDISAIPIEAVQRVDVIVDGASAIYGSDAVGGVANVVLKPDFDGVTLEARYGTATEGGLGTREYSATAGTSWSSGGLIATYKDVSVDPVYASDRGYTQYMDDLYSLYGGSDLRSGLVSAHQSLGDAVELRLDAFHTERNQLTYIGYPAFYYKTAPAATISFVAPSVQFSLPAGWVLQAGGAFGKNEIGYRDYMVTSATGLVTPGANGCYCNDSKSYEIGAEGPLFGMGGGDARLALGVGSRTDDFLIQSFTSGAREGGDESSRYGYAELSLPVIGPDSNIAAVRRLELSAALRSEDYDSFGQVTTPKLGLIYHPNGSITVKTSWGKSFKAPTLLQRYSRRIAYLRTTEQLGGTDYPANATVLVTEGGSADHLDAERARTWTASIVIHPQSVAGLDVELSYFDIDYTGRVIQPIRFRGQVLSNPDYAQFIFYAPTPEQQAQLLTVFDSEFYNYSGGSYDPANVIAIVRNEYVNAARQQVRGLDLSGSYRIDLADSHLTIRGAASWLESSQQNSIGQSSFDLAGKLFNPAKVSGRVGAVWTPGSLSIGGFVNYVGGVTNEFVASSEETSSFTTFDATLRYDAGEREGALSGLDFSLSVENLFNREPPLFTTPAAVFAPYDSTNYSAIGRFISVSVSKHW